MLFSVSVHVHLLFSCLDDEPVGSMFTACSPCTCRDEVYIPPCVRLGMHAFAYTCRYIRIGSLYISCSPGVLVVPSYMCLDVF